MFVEKLTTWIARLNENHRLQILFLLLIIVLGTVPRIIGFAVMPGEFFHNDGAEYYDISKQLYHGNGFSVSSYRWYETPPPDRTSDLHPDYSRPPLLSLIGAAFFHLPWSWDLTAKTVCLLLSALCSIQVFLLGKKIFRSPAVGIISALIYTFYPYSIYYSICWSSENLFISLLLGMFLLLIRGLQQNYRILPFALSGICLALMVLTRPQGAVFYPVFGLIMLIFFLWRKTERKKIFRSTACFLFLSFLILLPWMIRNYRLAGVPTPLTFYGPYAFNQASSDVSYFTYRYIDMPEYKEKTDAEWNRFHAEKRAFLAEKKAWKLTDANPYWTQWAWDYIRENPQKMLFIVSKRVQHFFRACPNTTAISGGTAFCLKAYFTVFWLLFLTGIWAARKNRYAMSLLIPPLLALGMAVPFLMVLRYRYPFFAPFASILVAYGLFVFITRMLERKRQHSPAEE